MRKLRPMLQPVEIVAAALMVAKIAGDFLLASLNRREIERNAGSLLAQALAALDDSGLTDTRLLRALAVMLVQRQT